MSLLQHLANQKCNHKGLWRKNKITAKETIISEDTVLEISPNAQYTRFLRHVVYF